MIREYFCGFSNPIKGIWAWLGLFVVIAHSVFNAWIKLCINEWYSGFYNLLQTSGDIESIHDISTALSGPIIHPEYASGEIDLLRSRTAAVYGFLWKFIVLVTPSMIIHPVFRWIRSNWAFEWRMALMLRYFQKWSPNHAPIEGASQRLHEDTQRFARGMETCVVSILDSALTLAVFIPVLTRLGAEVTAPTYLLWADRFWLVIVAVVVATMGLLGAVLTGRRLVDLEFENQRVEAVLRKNCVLIESAPNSICTIMTSPDTQEDISSDPGAPIQLKMPDILPIWVLLTSNYRRLFANFFLLNVWLSVWDQLMTVLPYVIVAPLLFTEVFEERINMGTLIQTSDSFSKVFGALSVIADSWGAINEFASTVVRLRQFEQSLQFGLENAKDGQLMARGLPQSDSSATDEVTTCIVTRHKNDTPVPPANNTFTTDIELPDHRMNTMDEESQHIQEAQTNVWNR